GKWNRSTGERLAFLLEHPPKVYLGRSWVCTPGDGVQVPGGTPTYRLRWYDLATARPAGVGPRPAVPSGAASAYTTYVVGPDGTMLIWFSSDSPVLQVWKPARPAPPEGAAREPAPDRSFPVGAVSPDGRAVLTGDGEAADGRPQGAAGERIGRPLRGPGHLPVFSRDGRLVATAAQPIRGLEPVVRVWDAITGRPATPPLVWKQYVRGLALSPDGATLAGRHRGRD